MNRTILTLAAAAALTAAAASPASAASVDRYDINATTANLNFRGAFTETNKVTVTMATKGYVDYADAGAKITTAVPACSVLQGGAHVECDATPLTDLGVNVILGDGNDAVLVMPPPAGYTYWDVGVQGQDGADTLESRGPATRFAGGIGNDRLIPGPAADDLDGEDGVDTVDYSTRVAPVSVDLGTDQKVNGAAGENDRIRRVENVLGGAAGDKLLGSDDKNQITGGAGADTISGKGGGDTIESRDNVKDTIGCGTGTDTVNADYVDTVSADCETVKRGGQPVGPGQFAGPDAPPPPLPAPPMPKDPNAPSDPGDPGSPSDPGNPGNSGNPSVDTVAPKLSKVSFAPRTFRAAKGSALRLSLSEAGALSVKVERLSRGRKVGKTCAKETAKLRRRHAKPCTRGTKVATVTRGGLAAGAAKTRFSGKVGKKALKPGAYRATLTATDAAGNRSAPVKAKFFVKR